MGCCNPSLEQLCRFCAVRYFVESRKKASNAWISTPLICTITKSTSVLVILAPGTLFELRKETSSGAFLQGTARCFSFSKSQKHAEPTCSGGAVEQVSLIAGATDCIPIVRTPCLLQSASMTLRLTMSMTH